MAWISVHEQILGGKLRSLAKELVCSQNEALGLLVRLWLWGINNATPDGKLESADKDDIADVLNIGIDRRYKPENAVEAMITTGWLDSDDGYLYIHDWKEWQKQWYKALKIREADNERKAKERAKRKVTQPELLPTVPPEISRFKPSPQEEYTTTPEPPKKPTVAYTMDFEEFWTFYPRKIGKVDAYKCYKARLEDGWSPEELLEAAQKYAAMIINEHRDTDVAKHPKTFLSEDMTLSIYTSKSRTSATQAIPESSGRPSNSHLRNAPTKELIREYAKIRRSSVNPDQFFEYYDSANWRDSDGKPVLNWQQKFISWEINSPRSQPSKGGVGNIFKEMLQEEEDDDPF